MPNKRTTKQSIIWDKPDSINVSIPTPVSKTSTVNTLYKIDDNKITKDKIKIKNNDKFQKENVKLQKNNDKFQKNNDNSIKRVANDKKSTQESSIVDAITEKKMNNKSQKSGETNKPKKNNSNNNVNDSNKVNTNTNDKDKTKDSNKTTASYASIITPDAKEIIQKYTKHAKDIIFIEDEQEIIRDNENFTDIFQNTKVSDKKIHDTNTINDIKSPNKNIKNGITCNCNCITHDFSINCYTCGRLICVYEFPLKKNSITCTFCKSKITRDTNELNVTFLKTLQDQYIENNNNKESSSSSSSLIELDSTNDREFIKAETFLQTMIKRVRDKNEQRIQDEQEDFYKINTIDNNDDNNTIEDINKDNIFITNNLNTYFDETILLGSNIDNENLYTMEQYEVEDNDIYVRPKSKDKLIKNNDNNKSNIYCMSMHQPWASLLVHGIKRFEGRDWYTTYRGKLWIASTQKQLDETILCELQQEYMQTYNISISSFPTVYPIGYIIGYVYVDNVLTQEQFQQYRKDLLCKGNTIIENSISEYVFICSHFTILHVPIPITGEHKIYKISKDISKRLRTMEDDGLLQTVTI